MKIFLTGYVSDNQILKTRFIDGMIRFVVGLIESGFEKEAFVEMDVVDFEDIAAMDFVLSTE